ncbi:Uncharacterised protein [Raoultella terrigena]|uniref:Uncharacterized protein n=1 Tax=Raoultella terrigena TaxID=577 RepID=A0A4U9D2F5_RAOTE|nr:Uncharacterised protein [Raoultella terrigena]
MTVSLDTPLRGGTNEGRQRIVRGLRRGRRVYRPDGA